MQSLTPATHAEFHLVVANRGLGAIGAGAVTGKHRAVFVLVAAHRSTLGGLVAGELEHRGEPILYHLPVRSKEFGPGARYRARGGSGKTRYALIAVRRLKEFVR